MAFRNIIVQTLAICLASGSAGTVEAKQPITIKHTDQNIEIDGLLTESDWALATPISSFLRFLPSEGEAPPGKTDVRFMQNKTHLFISAKISETPYEPLGRISPREQINDDDQIGIYLDTIGDGRTGYIFYFNALGIQQDIRYSHGNWFVEYNTIYESMGRKTATGYTLEIAIPFRSLQYPNVDSADWRVMITRKIPHLGSKYSHPKLKRNHNRMFQQAVPIVGLTPPPAGSGLAIQPAIAISQEINRDENDELGLDEEAHILEQIRPSLNLRWGITPDTGLTATINPDYSQVEGDQRQINLNQRFAFYYPERRPFFLDNLDQFKDQSESLYTRSIVSPLIGVKLAGQEKELGFGALYALDQTPQASVHERGTPGFTDEDLQGRMAHNMYMRVRKNAFGTGLIGLFMSQKHISSIENPLSDPPTSNRLGRSELYGMEMTLPLSSDTVITKTASYSNAGVDDNLLRGGAVSSRISHNPSKGWGWSVDGALSTKDYRRELGFTTNSGVRSFNFLLGHTTLTSEGHVFKPEIRSGFNTEENGNYWIFGGYNQAIKLGGRHSLNFWIGPKQIQFMGQAVTGYDVDLRASSRVSNQFRGDISLKHEKTINYQDLSPINMSAINGKVTIRPTQAIRLNLNGIHQILHHEDEEWEQGTQLFGRLSWQFTRSFGFVFIQQASIYTSEELPSLNSQILFTWMTSPGTEAYIGGTLNTDGGDERRIENMQLFAKYTHFFQ